MSDITPINKSLPVLEGKTNFLSGIFLRWLNFIGEKLNQAIVTDANGNIGLNGSTIPATLSSTYTYVFDGLTVVHKTKVSSPSSGYLQANNCYFDGTDFRSISNTGLLASFYSLSPAAFVIRESTVVVSSVGQIMLMTVVRAPT